MYQLTKDKSSLIRLADGANIPLAPGNRDFNEALEVLGPLVIQNEDGSFEFLPDEEVLLSFPKPPLEDVKKQLTDNIDSEAGIVRTTYITVSPGQEGTYTEKASEFDAFVAAGKPSEFTSDETLGVGFYSDGTVEGKKYFYVAAEVKSLGFDPATATPTQIQSAIDNVLVTRDAWTMVNAAIEGARLGGKALVKAATTHEEAQATFDEVMAKLALLRKP